MAAIESSTKPPKGSLHAEIAYRKIRAMILRSQLRAGEKTSVARLANAIGIGRTPVKEAITRLTAEGLLHVSERSGTFVARLSPEDVQHLFDLRKLYENYAAEAAIERVTQEQIDKLDSLLTVLEQESLSKPSSERSVVRFIDADVLLHKEIIAAAGNPYLLHHYSLLNLHLQVATYLIRHHSAKAQERHNEHVEIVEALRNRDLLTLRKVLSRHATRVEYGILDSMREDG
jgi:DNA-binding GntR family transcriptional regulator